MLHSTVKTTDPEKLEADLTAHIPAAHSHEDTGKRVTIKEILTFRHLTTFPSNSLSCGS